MNEKSLKDMLHRADLAADSPAPAPDLARTVRLAGAARRRTRAMVAGVGGAMAAAVLVTVVWHPSGHRAAGTDRQAVAAVKAAPREATLAQLQSLLERSRQEQRIADLQAELKSIPADPLAAKVEQAAARMWEDAQRCESEKNPAVAVKLYELLAQQFPDTSSGKLAIKRLGKTQPTTGESI